METVAIIEARMGSTRLPGKVLLPIMGRPMLELLLERVRRAQHLDQVVVATTTNNDDDAIEALTRRLGLSCFRGSMGDVLDRVLRAARSVNADIIVELTGDCPLIDPDIIDQVLTVYQANAFDYVSTHQPTYPRGVDTQVFSTAVLEEVYRLTRDPTDREHVSLYIYEHPQRFRVHRVRSGLPEKYRALRLTVDTPQDYELIRHIYEELYPANPRFGLTDVLDLFDRRPQVFSVNQAVAQKPVR